MKKLALPLLILVLFGFKINPKTSLNNRTVLSADEVLTKAIAFHDPDGVWLSFEGAVKLRTARTSGNTFGDEIITINVKDDFYSSKRIAGTLVAEKGIKYGKCFQSVNGNEAPDESEIKKYRIECWWAERMKEHQYCHFGLIMMLKKSGLSLQEEVKEAEFQGKKCYEITFIGDADKVSHPYYEGIWTLYLDLQEFSLMGYEFDPKKGRAYYAICHGIMELNGIKIPQNKAYYSKETDEYGATDLFVRADDNFGLDSSL